MESRYDVYLVELCNILQDPDLFIPERWSNNNPDIELLKELYLPFAYGKRNCVGQTLAIMELKVATANILRNLRLELENNVKAEWYLTYKPADALLRVYVDEI